MSDMKRRGSVHNGFSTLVKAIEELSGQSIDLNDNQEQIDIKAIRRKEAIAASREISMMKLDKHKNFVNSVYEEHRIDPRFTFNSIQIDQANSQALATARGFCATINILSKTDIAPQLLLVQGGPGSGKTVLANCIANEFLNTLWKDVELCTYSEIKRKRTPSSTDTSFDIADKSSKWDRLIKVDLLIIDALCQNNESLTLFDKQIIPELFRARRARNLPLVITTPISPTAMHMHFGDEIFESIKEFDVMTAALLGNSRRAPITFAGANLL